MLNGELQDPSLPNDMGHLEQFHLAPSMHCKSQDLPMPHPSGHGSPLQGWAKNSLSRVLCLKAGIGI